MNKIQTLLEVVEDLTFENYVEIAEALTKFDRHEIDKEMNRQASVYSYYQGLLSVAKKRLDEANLELTRYIAKTSNEKQRSTPTKISVKATMDFVESRDDFALYNQKVIDASEKYTMFKGLVSSLDQKKDMLVQLSSNRRAETNLYR